MLPQGVGNDRLTRLFSTTLPADVEVLFWLYSILTSDVMVRHPALTFAVENPLRIQQDNGRVVVV